MFEQPDSDYAPNTTTRSNVATPRGLHKCSPEFLDSAVRRNLAPGQTRKIVDDALERGDRLIPIGQFELLLFQVPPGPG